VLSELEFPPFRRDLGGVVLGIFVLGSLKVHLWHLTRSSTLGRSAGGIGLELFYGHHKCSVTAHCVRIRVVEARGPRQLQETEKVATWED
jgi:hypothetical protein